MSTDSGEGSYDDIDDDDEDLELIADGILSDGTNESADDESDDDTDDKEDDPVSAKADDYERSIEEMASIAAQERDTKPQEDAPRESDAGRG